jgi:NDP-sugar pyrophosphorylase family protein
MKAIIICGGLSTRLGEITKTTPKILLDIKGKTVLDWQLEKLKKLGIDEAVLAAGHLSNELIKQVGESRNGVRLNYAVEKERLGTGGAIKHAWKHIPGEDSVIVLNGDILTTTDLAHMVGKLKKESDGLILATKVPDAASYGTLEYDATHHLKAFKEKEGRHEPGYINGGFYLFNNSFKKYFPQADSFSIEYDVFPNVKELYVAESDEPWIDIGVPERLAWAREFWDGE